MRNNIVVYYKTYHNKKYDIYNLRKKSPFVLLLLGSIIGFVNGFWGGGGGMLCVPTLSYIVGLEEKNAHATAILVMLPLSIASFIIYAINGYLQFDQIAFTGIGFVVGGLVGSYILKSINNIVLKMIFSFVIIAGGVWLII